MKILYEEGGLDFRIEHRNYDLMLIVTVDCPSNLSVWIYPEKHVNIFDKESAMFRYRFTKDKGPKHFFYTIEAYSEIFIGEDIGFYLLIKEAFDNFSDEALEQFTIAFEKAKQECEP